MVGLLLTGRACLCQWLGVYPTAACCAARHDVCVFRASHAERSVACHCDDLWNGSEQTHWALKAVDSGCPQQQSTCQHGHTVWHTDSPHSQGAAYRDKHKRQHKRTLALPQSSGSSCSAQPEPCKMPHHCHAESDSLCHTRLSTRPARLTPQSVPLAAVTRLTTLPSDLLPLFR